VPHEFEPGRTATYTMFLSGPRVTGHDRFRNRSSGPRKPPGRLPFVHTDRPLGD
jgi:hypothetical protein